MKKYILIPLLSTLLAMPSVFAGVITCGVAVTLGNVCLADAPTSLERDTHESNDFVHLFSEIQNFMLIDDLFVDHIVPSSLIGPDPTTFGTIISGTEINSYLFHFDAIGDSTAGTDVREIFFNYTFANEDILGIIWSGPADQATSSASSLTSSDYLAFGSSYYQADIDKNMISLGVGPGAGRGRGTEGLQFSLDNTQDFFQIDGNNIDGHFKVQPKFADQIRIITRTRESVAVPAPAAVWLFGTGLICLMTFNRKRKQAKK